MTTPAIILGLLTLPLLLLTVADKLIGRELLDHHLREAGRFA